MYNNSLRKLRVFLVFFILFSMVLVNECSFKVLAATTLTVSQTVETNKVTIKVSDNINLTDSVSLLVVEKNTNSIVYMDQAALVNGEYIFKSVLPMGVYKGYVSSLSSDKVPLNDITITYDAKITGFEELNVINVEKGQALILPNTVIANFDDSISREVGVQWTDIPNTNTIAKYTVIGKVNGTTITVSQVVNVIEAVPTKDTTAPSVPTGLTAIAVSNDRINLTWTVSTDNVGVVGYKIFRDNVEKGTALTTSYSDIGLNAATQYSYTVKAYDTAGNLSEASAAVTAKTFSGGSQGSSSGSTSSIGISTVNGSSISSTPVLDKNTAVAATEISSAFLNTALANGSVDSNGIKTANINIAGVDGAKKYETTIPVSLISQDTKTQEINISTPFAKIEVPSNMLIASQVAGLSKASFTIRNIDKSSIDDKKLVDKIGDRPLVELGMKLDGKDVTWENESSAVKVSIPYKPTGNELANPEHIIVWGIDGNGNAIKVTNAKYNPDAGVVTAKANQLGKLAVSFEMKTFVDISTHQWAQSQIEVLASKGVINGTSETTFSPAENITRADFLVLVVKTLGLNADFKENFNDVNKDDYYYNALGIAKKLGISKGDSNNQYNPKELITRQDMMVICARALKMSEIIKAQGSAADIQKYIDKDKVASYAVDGIASMVKEGIVKGDANYLNPQENTTRAEAAVIMYRIFNKI